MPRLVASSMMFCLSGAAILPSAAVCCSSYTLWKKDGSVDLVSLVFSVLGAPSTVGVISPGRKLPTGGLFTGLKLPSSSSSESSISLLGAILADINCFGSAPSVVGNSVPRCTIRRVQSATQLAFGREARLRLDAEGARTMPLWPSSVSCDGRELTWSWVPGYVARGVNSNDLHYSISSILGLFPMPELLEMSGLTDRPANLVRVGP